MDLAFRGDALAHLEAQRALDERHVFPEVEVVRVGPVDTSDLVDVAEALGGEKRGFGPGALEHGVDRYRRAVQEGLGVRKRSADVSGEARARGKLLRGSAAGRPELLHRARMIPISATINRRSNYGPEGHPSLRGRPSRGGRIPRASRRVLGPGPA